MVTMRGGVLKVGILSGSYNALLIILPEYCWKRRWGAHLRVSAPLAPSSPLMAFYRREGQVFFRSSDDESLPFMPNPVTWKYRIDPLTLVVVHKQHHFIALFVMFIFFFFFVRNLIYRSGLTTWEAFQLSASYWLLAPQAQSDSVVSFSFWYALLLLPRLWL